MIPSELDLADRRRIEYQALLLYGRTPQMCGKGWLLARPAPEPARLEGD